MNRNDTINSIFSYIKRFGIDDLNWTKSSLCGHQPFHTFSLIPNGFEKLSGSGTASSLSKASYIASFELLERVITFFSPYSNESFENLESGAKLKQEKLNSMFPDSSNWITNTSSGCATHTILERSRENAVLELIERHTLLKAQAEKAPGLLTTTNLFNRHPGIKKIEGIKFRSISWVGPLNKFVTRVEANRSGLLVSGHGCADSLNSSIDRALSGIIPKVIVLRSKMGLTSILATNLIIKKRDTLTLNENLYLTTQDQLISVDSGIDEKDIWVQTRTMRPMGEKKFAYYSRATSPVLQGMFHGKWSISKINPKAISRSCRLPSGHHGIR